MRMTCYLVVAALLLIAAEAPDDDVKKEQAKLRGTWTPVVQEANGERKEGDKLKIHEWVFEDDKVTIKEAAKSREHSFKVDPIKAPKTIDLFDRQGDATGHGIYKLDGDMLTIAIAKPSSDRPTEFTTKKDSPHVVIVLKREKH